MKMKLICCITTALLVFVCSAIAGKEETIPDFGRLLPGKYQLAIRAYMAQRLKDPYSAVYRFDTPYKAMLTDGLLVGHQKHFGWIVPTWINAKNSFGGYSGEQLYIIMFFSDHKTMGDATDAFGYGRVKRLP
jgi:hypothetical protein